MIINTGMRTDIPAFYSQWLENRLNAGFVCVRNPLYPQRITRYRLSPDVVDLIVFCTKDPIPMLCRFDCLSPYRQFWFVSITGYGKKIEPGINDKYTIMDAFRRLSEMVGSDKVVWRYDPIFLIGPYTVEYHIRAFEKIASYLEGYTHTAVISFVDLYNNVRINFPQLKAVRREDALIMAKAMVASAERHGMKVQSCCEGNYLSRVGVDVSGCMTQEVLEKAIGCRLKPLPKVKNRPGCDCFISCDIGAYDSCPHLCRYCYANLSPETAAQNFLKHDSESPLLIGNIEKGDIVTDAKQESWLDLQERII